MKPLRVATIGMGGFAVSHHNVIHQLEAAGECQLICTCDPNPAAFAQRMLDLDFTGRGVRFYDHYLAMLDECTGGLDLVTIPTPVPLHAEMHRACVERGLAVYLEKPPTLDWRELEEMLVVEQRASRLTNVGFNYIDDPIRQELKGRILAGEFGAIRKIGLKGIWPRPISYYRRAPWAGRLMMDERLILDSCMGNALAHHVHDALFWAGTGGLFSWAEVRSVNAELYRAHEIEGVDTVFASAVLQGGAVLEIALTHACDGVQMQQEWVVCEKATVHYAMGEEIRILWKDGRVEWSVAENNVWLNDTLPAYFAYVRGLRDRPTTRLEDCRPFVYLCDLVYVAAGKIATVPETYLERSRTPDGTSENVAIRDIRPIVDQFFATGAFPSAQGVPWGSPGGYAGSEDLPVLPEVVRRMV